MTEKNNSYDNALLITVVGFIILMSIVNKVFSYLKWGSHRIFFFDDIHQLSNTRFVKCTVIYTFISCKNLTLSVTVSFKIMTLYISNYVEISQCN